MARRFVPGHRRRKDPYRNAVLAPRIPPNPFACPNDPPCGHSGILHDIYEPADPRPMCCADGCGCGKPEVAL